MDKIKEEQTTWDNIYQKGRMLKHIPSDRAIMAILNNLPQNRKKSEINTLEVGCGSAANLFFLAERGFNTAGIDIAPTAIAYAQKRFDDARLKADLSVGNFYPLKFEDESFDFVIDCGALVCVDMNDCRKAGSEINRVLKKDGKFFFNPFSDRHSSAVSGGGNEGSGEKLVCGGYRKNIEVGLTAYGALCFYSSSDIQSILTNDKWNILSMLHVERFDYIEPLRAVHAHWEIFAEKLA